MEGKHAGIPPPAVNTLPRPPRKRCIITPPGIVPIRPTLPRPKLCSNTPPHDGTEFH